MEQSLKFKLRFPRTEVAKWAARYDFSNGDAVPLALAPAVQKRAYLKRAEFLALGKWKTPRRECAAHLYPPPGVGRSRIRKALKRRVVR